MFLRKDDVFLKINSRFQQPFNGKKIKLKYLYLVLLNLIRKQIIICFFKLFLQKYHYLQNTMDVTRFFAVANKRKLESVNNDTISPVPQKQVAKVYAVRDVVQLREAFFEVVKSEIKYGIVTYELKNLDNLRGDDSAIKSDLQDPDYKKVNKAEASKLKTTSTFVIKYNRYVQYFNKKHCVTPIKTTTVSHVYNILIKECHLTIIILENILRKIQGCHDNSLCLSNLTQRPFGFIRAEFQLLSFEKADSIDKLYDLNVSFEEKCSVWHFDFIHKYNSFYVEKQYFYKGFNEFCEKTQRDPSMYVSMVHRSCMTVVVKDREYITTEYLFNLEKNLGDKLCDLFLDKKTIDIDLDQVNHFIEVFETKSQQTLCDEQKQAIVNTVTNKLSIITGYPGTGKTTIMECVVFVLVECNLAKPGNISVIAPTGLAFVQLRKRMAELEKRDNFKVSKDYSGTCHRVMLSKFDTVKRNFWANQREPKEDYQPVNIDLIIIDEFSMVDIFMFETILEYCDFFKCRLLLVGDNNQLPSIGPGCVLKSIIESDIFPESLSKLKIIHRQNTGNLKDNILRMNDELLTFDHFDETTMIFKNINKFLTPDLTQLNATQIELLIDEYGLTQHNCKFLSYFKNEKFKFNVGNLNNIAQTKFNQNAARRKFTPNQRRKFYDSDVIMRTENDYSEETLRANGETAEIQSVSMDGSSVDIQYHDETNVKLDPNDLENGFDLAYALTVHKAQGSQCDTIVIFIDNAQSCWDKRTLYTAISRAVNRCIIVSNYDSYLAAQRRNNNSKISLFLEMFSKYEFDSK